MIAANARVCTVQPTHQTSKKTVLTFLISDEYSTQLHQYINILIKFQIKNEKTKQSIPKHNTIFVK